MTSDHTSELYDSYAQAVADAVNGNQDAFRFLYESTYRDKYFIAQKYMRNDSDTQDVIQDAYIRAWRNLEQLQEPDKFPNWLSMIVASTALNALKKKKDLPFSALEQESEDGNTFSYEEADWRKEYQPEHAYTDKEVSDLLKELLDSLSDEQRFCMLMYYVEEHSVGEIAQVIGCSEGTVKSRLNYGRKNLKSKAAALEKKGYTLYSMAPVPLLLLLVRAQKTVTIISIPTINTAAAAALTVSGATGESAAGTGASSVNTAGFTTTSVGGTGTTTASSVTAATAGAAKAAGGALGIKIAAAVIGITILGGAGFAATSMLSAPSTEQTADEDTTTAAAVDITTGTDTSKLASEEETSSTDELSVTDDTISAETNIQMTKEERLKQEARLAQNMTRYKGILEEYNLIFDELQELEPIDHADQFVPFQKRHLGIETTTLMQPYFKHLEGAEKYPFNQKCRYQYTFIDIDGNGTDEMLIVHENGIFVQDIRTFDGNEAVRPYDYGPYASYIPGEDDFYYMNNTIHNYTINGVNPNSDILYDISRDGYIVCGHMTYRVILRFNDNGTHFVKVYESGHYLNQPPFDYNDGSLSENEIEQLLALLEDQEIDLFRAYPDLEWYWIN